MSKPKFLDALFSLKKISTEGETDATNTIHLDLRQYDAPLNQPSGAPPDLAPRNIHVDPRFAVKLTGEAKRQGRGDGNRRRGNGGRFGPRHPRLRGKRIGGEFSESGTARNSGLLCLRCGCGGVLTVLQEHMADRCRVEESNPRPTDYKSAALPTELTRRRDALYVRPDARPGGHPHDCRALAR